MPRHAADRNLHVEFYMGSVESGPDSEAAGHPVYIDRPFIRIHVPGDPNTVIDTKVNDYYKARFADEFRAFMAGATGGVSGWSLKQWPIVSASQVKNLEYLNIHTVEQLAGLTDAQLQRVGGGGYDLRAKAQAALAAAADGAAVAAQAAEAQRMREELDALKALVAAQSETQRGPGRPRKEAADA